MSKQMFYIITRLPYAGKTTLANELAKRFNFTICSVDEVLDEEKRIVEKMTQEDWNHVYSKAYEKLKKCLSEGKTVIFDGASLKRSERKTQKRIAKSMNVPSKLVYVNTPKKEIKQRWLDNQKNKKRDQLAEKTLNLALNMFEEPQPEEEPIIYNQNMSLDQWIKSNLEQD